MKKDSGNVETYIKWKKRPHKMSNTVKIFVGDKEISVTVDKIASAYAGAWVAKEIHITKKSALFPSNFFSFKEKYSEVYQSCIQSAKRIGLSATFDTINFHRPGKHVDHMLKDLIDHPDNPFYPFFEE